MSIVDDDNRLLGEAGYTGSYSDRINEALESSTGIRGATPDLWMKLFDDLGIPDGALPNRKLAYLQTLGATSNVLTQAIREVLGLGLPSVAVARNFLTFGGINESGTIPAWTATGDFEIEVDIATTDTSALPTILGNNSDTLSFLSVSGATGVVRSRNPSGREILGTIPVNDGKLHTIKLSVVSGTASLFVDGVPDGSVSGIVGSSVYDAVGKNQFGNYFNGIIANISLTEAGGDNRFYPMSSGSTTTEPDTLGSGATDMTLNNIVAGDWELFTQVQKEIERAALTFGGVNESGSIPAWGGSGSKSIELDFIPDSSAEKWLFSDWNDSTDKRSIAIRIVSGTVQTFVSVDGVATTTGPTKTITDFGKLTNLKFDFVSGSLLSLQVNDEAPVTSATGITSLFDTGETISIARKSTGSLYFNNVIANISLTEAGGDNRFYAMISGSTTTEPDTLGDGSTDMTLNNIVADDWGTIVTQPFKWVGNVTSTVIEGPQA